MIPGIIPVVTPNVAIEATSLSWRAGGTTGAGTAKSILGVTLTNEVIPPNERWIVVCIQNLASTPATASSMTIGGTSAAEIATGLTGAVLTLNTRYTWFAANVPQGTSVDVLYTSSTIGTNGYQIFQAVNLDFSAITDSAYDAGTGIANLSIDCPALGVILGSGNYNYQSGSTPNTADFTNLTTLDFVDASSGTTAAGTIFPTAQTALTTNYDPSPNTNITRTAASVIAAAAKVF